MITDTHCHLFDTAFDADRDEVIKRAAEVGVGRMLTPAIDSSTHSAQLALCDAHTDIFVPMMGVHPTSVNDTNWKSELDIVERYLESGRKFCGIGEIGLDYYWSDEFKEIQKRVFDAQVELALRYHLPIAVHTRSAWDDMTEIIESYTGRGLGGVMHAFCGSAEQYRRIRKAGNFVFGVGGMVTFKNGGVAELMPLIDLGDIVVETDSPYLAPVPFRGKRNEPAYIVNTVRRIAELKGLTPLEVENATTANAERIFGR